MIVKNYFFSFVCVFVMLFCSFITNAQSNSSKNNSLDLELKLNNGKLLNLQNELKGKVVLLDFWYRGCFPCLKAIPDLIKLQEEFKGELVIVGINDRDIQEDVTDYFEYKRVNYLSTYKTENNISKKLNINIFPTTVLYDKKGNMIQIDNGYSKKGYAKLRKTIKNALKYN